MRKFLLGLLRFCTRDNSLSAFLFLLVTFLFIAPHLPNNFVFKLVPIVILSLLMVVGLVAVTKSYHYFVITLLISLSSLLTGVFSNALDSRTLEFLSTFLSLSFLCFLVYIVTTRVFEDGPVNWHRIKGGIAVYLLLALTWTEAYTLVNLIFPGSFRFSYNYMQAVPSSLFTYFSIVTISTVGYGDIIPFHPLVRSLASFEAVVGILFPTVFIGRLVALEIEHSRNIDK